MSSYPPGYLEKAGIFEFVPWTFRTKNIQTQKSGPPKTKNFGPEKPKSLVPGGLECVARAGVFLPFWEV